MGAYRDELHALRQRTPIGVRHGLALLQQTNGDVAAASSRNTPSIGKTNNPPFAVQILFANCVYWASEQ
jgi:hypothetical protein